MGETPRQAGMLFSAHTASMFITLAATVVQLRWMEPAERGRYALALTVVLLATLLLEPGVFPAGGRVLALSPDRETERRTLGALTIVALGLGVILSILLVIASFPVDLIFKKNIGWILLSAAPFALFLPFQTLAQESCQGLNQISRLSMFQLSLSLLNLVFQITLAFADRLTARTALMAQMAAISLSSLWAVLRMRPEFVERERHLRLILKEARSFGFNVYLARITGTASTRLDNLVIGYYLPEAMLGLYDNAQKVSSPIATLARSIAITRYRAFAAMDRVSNRISFWNTTLLAVGSIALVLVGPFALRFAFPKYADAAPLLLPFAVWGFFGGLFQPYHMFLGAHGRGAEIRNIALAITLFSVVALLIAVPKWGIRGAAWSAAAAMALDYVLAVYYYRKFRRTLE
ncbi:MAG: lipopolysaccharide biosynthesis protein [Acidobacteriota bacterium]